MCEPSTREKIGRMCRNCLNGVWRTVDHHELVIDRVRGNSNIVYFCAIPPYLIQSEHDGPSKVVIRFYGQNLANDEGTIDVLLKETFIVALLSERKLCPRLYGIFPGGRIEEFIPSRELQTKELSDPAINAVVAKKMAMFHALDIPINKEPSWLWNTITRWMNAAKARSCRPLGDELGGVDGIKQKGLSSTVPREWWILETEMVWLKSFLDSLGSTVVFCHNDVFEGNILVRETAETLEEKLVIIDFEYSSYNYRGYDLAQYFSQRIFDLTVEEHPKFAYVPENLPSMDQRLHFLHCYLEASEQAKGLQSSYDADKNESEAHRLLRETDCFILANHFLWGVRAILNAPVSVLPFGFREYAAARFTAYYQHKNYVMEKYGHVIDSQNE